MATDLVVRTLDLTRSPDEQWNEEMVKLVASQVLKRASTRGEQIYCLAVADALALNPFIEEIYFLPTKSRDGSGPGIKPYIGRNGLVKKADDAGCYFESETVRENDKFRIIRKADGTRTCTHSYGHTRDRGEIVGAYAFLHDVDGRRQPAFFYAELDQYLPSFNEDWKMAASPWGNQRSAMIEKCAMIGAGRKRLQLGNVLIDGEIARVEQMGELRHDLPSDAVASAFDWTGLEQQLAGQPDAQDPATVIERLQSVVARVNELAPLSWPPAKLEMVLSGRSEQELLAIASQIEEEADLLVSRGVRAAGERSEGDAGDSSGTAEPSGEGLTEPQIADADVLPDEETVALLRRRAGDLEERLQEAESDEEREMLQRELEVVEREISATEDPAQERLM